MEKAGRWEDGGGGICGWVDGTSGDELNQLKQGGK